jgi:hypothetical protein
MWLNTPSSTSFIPRWCTSAASCLNVLVRAVLGRDGLEIKGVVLVVGVGQVNRVEVQHVGTQVLDVVQAGGQALQVAAPKVQLGAVEFGVFQVHTRLGRLGPIAQHLGRGVKRAFGIQVRGRNKPVDDDLVDDGAIAPVAFTLVKRGVVCGGQRASATGRSLQAQNTGENEVFSERFMVMDSLGQYTFTTKTIAAYTIATGAKGRFDQLFPAVACVCKACGYFRLSLLPSRP